MRFKLCFYRRQDMFSEKLSSSTLLFAIGQDKVVRDGPRPRVEWLIDFVLIKLFPYANANALHHLFRVLPIWSERVNIGKQTPLVRP
jgi:hypothetical protein